MKKQEHREVLPPAPGHTAGMWFQPGLKAKFITHPAILLHHVLPSGYILPLHKGGTTLRYRSGIYELILLFKQLFKKVTTVLSSLGFLWKHLGSWNWLPAEYAAGLFQIVQEGSERIGEEWPKQLEGQGRSP